MDGNKIKQTHIKVAATIRALEANHMKAAFLPERKDVLPMVRSLIRKGSLVATGGSVTLAECNLFPLLRSGDYRFLDRSKKGLSGEEIRSIYLRSFDADTYLCSANAITEHGELYCVDNTGNRVAALSWGPKQVIVVAGINKIVPDLASAVKRVKEEAAPANAIRLDRETFCMHHGRCVRPECDRDNLMALDAGACKETLCSNTLVLSSQRIEGRIKVLLVGENLGY